MERSIGSNFCASLILQDSFLQGPTVDSRLQLLGAHQDSGMSDKQKSILKCQPLLYYLSKLVQGFRFGHKVTRI